MAEQFQFVRAHYVAIPPVSRTLPPGDQAVMARSGGAVMLAIVADGQAYARFLAPDFIQAMLIQVGQRLTVGWARRCEPNRPSRIRKAQAVDAPRGAMSCSFAAEVWMLV
jgi:hypothetical protein